MVDIYDKLIYKLINEGKKEGNLLVLRDFEIEFERIRPSQRVMDLISISIPKKIEYIERTYWQGAIVKEKPCISKVEVDYMIFRSSRAFPTLYLDLVVLDNKVKPGFKIRFDKLFIGYQVVALNHIYPNLENLNNKDFLKILEHWKNRFKKPQKMAMLSRYQEFLIKKGVIKDER